MSKNRPLYWHQGLFLQPQHFQLMEQNFEARLAPILSHLQPYFWGIEQLELKKTSLGLKTVGIAKGSFLFQDGTFVEFPGNSTLQDRSFEDMAHSLGGKPLQIYVGLKKTNEFGENVTIQRNGGVVSGNSHRFVSDGSPESVNDIHGNGPVGHVKRMDYLLKIFWGTEKEQLGDYMLIPVAQLERNGSEFVFSPFYVPAALSIHASPLLAKLIKEIGDLLLSRSRQLEEYKSQRGIQRAEFGSRDMVYLLALRSINRYIPLLRHLTETPIVHPWNVYGVLRQTIGDLSCFSEKISVLGEIHESSFPSLPEYDHTHLFQCFSIAQKIIARMLDEITAGPDHIIPMVENEGIFSADLKPAVFDSSNRFYLAVTTDNDHKQTIQSIGHVAKLSSRDHLNLLISHALPGISLEHMVTPPQELPRRGNVLYFSIDSNGEQWAHVKKENNLSLSWDGAPEGLHLELMVVGK